MAKGEHEKVVSIERIRRPTPLHRGLFAHLNVWSELWRARFEKTVDSPDYVVLHVGSEYVNGDLEWSKRGADR